MRTLLVLLSLVAISQAVSFFDVMKEEWHSFKLEHNKNYDEQSDRFRFKIFYENRHKIAKHNQLYAAGKKTYKMGVNKYTDMLHTEFVQTMNGFNNTLRKLLREQGDQYVGVTFLTPENLVLPKSVDWRKNGAVTAVKDQGHCGSCWSFSATGALEAQHYRKTKVLVSLSEQNLVDCSAKYGNNGCNGGLMDNAFRYIKDNGGLDTEKSYPYEGIDDSCHFNPSTIGATDRGFVDVPEGDEDKLKAAVASVGPVSVAIDASHESFQFYTEGIYDEPECNAENLDHGVLVVGYGTDSEDHDYWLVKNSWGTSWGDGGYIKMARNSNNQCGIATAASYPLV